MYDKVIIGQQIISTDNIHVREETEKSVKRKVWYDIGIFLEQSDRYFCPKVIANRWKEVYTGHDRMNIDNELEEVYDFKYVYRVALVELD